jgi:hypothetical protein
MENIATENANRNKIEAALKTFQTGSTESDIAAKAKVSNKVAKGVLLDLVERKVVAECTVMRGNKQLYPGFILPEFVKEEKSPGQSELSECCPSVSG